MRRRARAQCAGVRGDGVTHLVFNAVRVHPPGNPFLGRIGVAVEPKGGKEDEKGAHRGAKPLESDERTGATFRWPIG